MGSTDSVTKLYLRNKAVQRDVIRLVAPDLAVSKLEELHAEEILVPYELESGKPKGRRGKRHLLDLVRHRDLLSMADVVNLTDGTTDYVIVGFESQTAVDLSMPVRVLLENVLNYAAQIEALRAKHMQEAKARGGPAYPRDFLSGLEPEDRLKPVITIVVYWGSEPWSGPKRLHDLLAIPPSLDKNLVDNNRLILLQPATLTDEQLATCDSSLGPVLRFLRDARDKETLQRTLDTDPAFQQLSPEAAHVIQAISGYTVPRDNFLTGGVYMKNTIFPWLEAERREAQEEIREEAEKARADAERARADAEKARADAEKARTDAEDTAQQLAHRQVLAMYADGLALPKIARYLEITEGDVQETLCAAGLL